VYILEGNIGVGKSTFLDYINKNCPDIKIIPEPTDNWAKQQYGQSLLENFYKDPKRWAYTLETLAMICRVRDHVREQQTPTKNRIMERSVYSGHYCFAYNGLTSGYFTSIEWEIYLKWVEFFVNSKCKAPMGFIYLCASPEICFERIKKRNRSSEEAITLEYVKQIHKYHENFLRHKTNIDASITKTPVLIIDCNKDFVINKNLLKEHIQKVRTFMCLEKLNIYSLGDAPL
jgi:deoxyadenosine/deoxycytidine kinase